MSRYHLFCDRLFCHLSYRLCDRLPMHRDHFYREDLYLFHGLELVVCMGRHQSDLQVDNSRQHRSIQRLDDRLDLEEVDDLWVEDHDVGYDLSQSEFTESAVLIVLAFYQQNICLPYWSENLLFEQVKVGGCLFYTDLNV